MVGDIKSLAKGSVKRARNYHFHKGQIAQATGILRSIEAQVGKTNPVQLRLADAYAREVLGHKRYAPWLHVYTAVARTFKEGWVPDNFFGRHVVPSLKGFYGQVSNLKGLTNSLFKGAAIPDVAYHVNGLFLDADYAPIPPGMLPAYLFGGTGKIVFKVDYSGQGKGVYFFSPQDFDIEKIRHLGNGVFQSYIAQHDLFNRFAPNSVATLRFTTVVDDAGDVTVRSCYLRLGRTEDTHVQSKSHLRVPIHPSTGAFGGEGYLTNWHTVEEHPDTRQRFAGNRVPAYARCLAKVVELHQKVPFARVVGWDVAVDAAENVRLMEWNAGHNDIKFSEATQGPCFAGLKWEQMGQTHPTLTELSQKPLFIALSAS